MILYQLPFLATIDLEKTIHDGSLAAVGAAAVALVILVLLAMFLNKRMPAFKPILFILIVAVTVGTTLAISGATVYLNIKSASGGPVHWHADYEIWACDNELALRNPQGLLSNKVGTPTLHEHNDKRIHLEGVPVTLPQDASLGKYMHVIGGDITSNTLVVPLDEESHFETDAERQDGDGNGANSPEEVKPFIKTNRDGQYASFVSGQKCGNQAAQVQVFVYKYDEKQKTYTQRKLEHPGNYAISQHSDVPPGDCIIMEFAPPKDKTNKLCKQYGVRDVNRCAQFGVPPNERSKVCVIKEVM